MIGLLALTVSLTSKVKEKTLPFDARYIVDTLPFGADGALTNKNIWQVDAAQWQAFEKENLGLSDRAHWITITPKALIENEQYLLEINYGLLDSVDVWVFTQPSNEHSQLQEIATFTAGDRKPFSDRAIQHEQFLFPIHADSSSLAILLQVHSKGPIKVPIRLWQKSDFIEYSGAHKLFMGLFFGYMIAMALSNLFIYATTRNSTFAVYTGYVVSVAMVVATLHGIGYRFLWPESIWFQERAIAFFACTTLIFIITFSIQVLALKNTSKGAYRLLKAFWFVFLLLSGLTFVVPYSLLLTSILIMIAATTPVILISSLLLAIKGNLIARYFSAAWAVLLIAGIGLTLENLGIYELPMDSSYLLMVGAIAETLLLALALAISFSTQYKQTETARSLAVENERRALVAKDELLQLQEKTKQSLEYSVEERTLELEIAMRELSEANHELERLSAIDPLTGLMNRRYFDKRLLAETRRSRRERRAFSLAMLDIDYFKKINDRYGHLAGDECLKIFAQILQQHIKRPADVICRYGGEEFVVILPATDLPGAVKLMEKVRVVIENTCVEFEGNVISMTVSIGVTAHITSSDDEQEKVLAYADKLLYQAKTSGRNQVIGQPIQGST
jgi:diguanylate cyclase (GGDEF)-like protein